MNEQQLQNDMDIIDVPDFNFDGYQVVRGEFFAHLYEPSITFNNYKVAVNMACIRKIPDFDFIQILVHPEKKKLTVRPCAEDERDSFRWCSSNKKRTPKQINCRPFFAKIANLMDWNPDYRYKMLGKLIRSNGETFFVFDLDSAEIFRRVIKDDGKVKSSRTPVYPESWKNQFGLSVEEHKKAMQINFFDDYAVFSLQAEPPKSKVTTNNSAIKESEGISYE